MGSNERLRVRVKYLKKSLIPKTQEESKELVRTTDLIISTPQKLATTFEHSAEIACSIRYLVIDEADKLFEAAEIPHMDKIIEKLKDTEREPQKAIFSATMQPNIEELVNTILTDHAKVLIGLKNATAHTVNQSITYVGNEQGKLLALRKQFKEGFKPPMLIFVQSKHRAKELHKELAYEPVNIGAMHADMQTRERDEVVEKFRRGELWVLICSDLMARGIDFKGVNTVVNYDFPQSIVGYIHRIGRAGRAGNKGTAITFATKDDVELLKPIANLMKKSGCEVADWMLKLKAPDKKRRKELEVHPVKRMKITTDMSAHIDRHFNRQLDKIQKKKQKSKRTVQESEDEFQIAGEDEELE
eukprot:TRINITY_DN4479_c0_g3_i2.p1 TRINITY_DN4479_c0_g3~~TRINITY_DN4479_c0_g3_i2.p1  ORF type:complete len:358 (+),score=100.46 TRINITY_DN4479_c0_g3_i2:853-1926(+)